MDWSSMTAVVIAGVSGVLIISILFWGGQAFMNLLERDEITQKLEHPQSHFHQPSNDLSVGGYIPDGQERLATQFEINDVDGRIESSRSVSATKPGQL